MDEQAKKTGAQALRENMRNERRNRSVNEAGGAADGASETFGSVDGTTVEQERATIQDAGRTAKRITPTGGKPARSDRGNRDDGRSPKREPGRERSGVRRTEENYSGAPAYPAATNEATKPASQHPIVGRFEASETILEPGVPRFDLTPEAVLPGRETYYKEDYRRTQRNGENVYVLISNPSQFITGDEYKSLTSRKEVETSVNSPSSDSANSPKPSFFKGGVLSKEEAEELYEPLVAALSDMFGYADKGLWKLCPQLDERPIWSNTTTREDQALAKMLLKRGQKSPAAALMVRETVNSADYVLVGMMIGPRAIETLQALRERPQAPKNAQGISLFRKAETA